MSTERQLLQNAATEIRNLRRTNDHLQARTRMFDNIMLLLETKLASHGMTETPDLVFQIERHLKETDKP